MIDDRFVPGYYVGQLGPAALPSVKTFLGQKLTRATCAAAQAAVDQLRAHAYHLRQYTVLTDEAGCQVRAYYGEAGNALAEAEAICALVNGNLSYHQPFPRADLYDLAIR